jgi:hypothetical protein
LSVLLPSLGPPPLCVPVIAGSISAADGAEDLPRRAEERRFTKGAKLFYENGELSLRVKLLKDSRKIRKI